MKIRRNRRILVVFVLIWISIIVYILYRDDSSEVLFISSCTDISLALHSLCQCSVCLQLRSCAGWTLHRIVRHADFYVLPRNLLICPQTARRSFQVALEKKGSTQCCI